jgi:hypothetical protein
VVLNLVVVPVEDVLVMLPVEFAKDVKEDVVKVVVDLKPVVVLLVSLSVELKA